MRARTTFLAFALAMPLVARATPDFPAALSQDLQLSVTPACTICHSSNEGGVGTVVKPFGKYLVSRGLAPFDESSLAGSLAAAQGEHHDTDGDGISDIDALKQGLDPNGSPSGARQIQDPSFGCNATGDMGGTALLLLVVGLRLALAACRGINGAAPKSLQCPPDTGKDTEMK